MILVLRLLSGSDFDEPNEHAAVQERSEVAALVLHNNISSLRVDIDRVYKTFTGFLRCHLFWCLQFQIPRVFPVRLAALPAASFEASS